METHIQKWGNSLAVRLPKDMTRKMKLHRGSRVSVVSLSKEIRIKPMIQPQHKTLEQLLAGITKKNRHPEFDWGKPMGKEVW